MATTKKTVTSTDTSSTTPAEVVPDTSELEARVQALEERLADLIGRLEKKMSF